MMRRFAAMLLAAVLLMAAVPAMALEFTELSLFHDYAIAVPDRWTVESEMADLDVAERQVNVVSSDGQSSIRIWVETFNGYEDVVRDNIEYLRDSHGVYDPAGGYYWLMQSLFTDETIYIEPLDKAGTVNGKSIVYNVDEYADAYEFQAVYFNDYQDGVYMQFVAYKEEYTLEDATIVWACMLDSLTHVEDGVQYYFEEYTTPDVVITGDSAKIRTEASLSGSLLVTASQGQAFPYIDETGDWYIVDVNGQTGYVHKGVAAIQ